MVVFIGGWRVMIFGYAGFRRLRVLAAIRIVDCRWSAQTISALRSVRSELRHLVHHGLALLERYDRSGGLQQASVVANCLPC